MGPMSFEKISERSDKWKKIKYRYVDIYLVVFTSQYDRKQKQKEFFLQSKSLKMTIDNLNGTRFGPDAGSYYQGT
jgi:hypothetical protein